MDILQEIKSEHKKFRGLIGKIEKADSARKQNLFYELFIKLKGHHEAEEKVLFKDVKELSDEEGKDIVLEMIE